MKKILAALAATVALLAPLTLVAAPAEAAGYCATATQYRQVHNGMSLIRVQQIMRAPGYYIDGAYTGPQVQWQLRGWNKCGDRVFDYTIGFIRGPVAVTGHVGWYVSVKDSSSTTQPNTTQRNPTQPREGTTMHKITKIVIAVIAVAGLATACDASSAEPGKVVKEGSGSGGVKASEKETKTEEPTDMGDGTEETEEVVEEEPEMPKVGDTVTVGDWDVTITGIDRDANAEIQHANMFNDRAKGVYVLVNYEATYHGSDRMGEPEMDLTWTFTTPDGKVQDESWNVTPSDDENWPTQTRKGGTVRDQVSFDVKGQVGGSIVSAEDMWADEYADFQMAP